jgi:hypothetical protein
LLLDEGLDLARVGSGEEAAHKHTLSSQPPDTTSLWVIQGQVTVWSRFVVVTDVFVEHRAHESLCVGFGEDTGVRMISTPIEANTTSQLPENTQELVRSDLHVTRGEGVERTHRWYKQRTGSNG